MQPDNNNASLETLNEIRSIMDRSARFISLSGWSGIWAGSTALVGAAKAYRWLSLTRYSFVGKINETSTEYFDPYTLNFIYLGLAVFCVALLGGFYFTYRKTKRLRQPLWNNASRQMVIQMFFPLFAGGVFPFSFIYYGNGVPVVPVTPIPHFPTNAVAYPLSFNILAMV